MSLEQLITGLEKTLEEMEELQEECSKGLLRSREVAVQLQNLDRQMQVLLPSESTAFRIFDRRKHEHTDWWTETISGYIDPSDCDNIAYRVETLRQILNELKPEFLRKERLPKTQYFFAATESYRAKKILFQIMKKAKSSIAIVDEYLDDAVFDYIESLDSAIAVQMVTGSKKPIFPKLLHALQQNRSNVTARENTSCHDRFVIIDNTEIWQLGTSINGFGKKAFMINKVTDQAEIAVVLSNLSNWWSGGTHL